MIRKYTFSLLALTGLLLLPAVSHGQTVVAAEDFDGGDVNMTSGFDTSLNFADPAIPFRLFGVHDLPTLTFAPRTLTDDTVEDVSQSGDPVGTPFEGDFVGIYGINKDDAFFAVSSYDEFFAGNAAALTGNWTFDISSAGLEQVTLSIDMGQLAPDDFDGVAGFNNVIFEYSIDGGAFQPAFTLEPIEMVGTGFEYRPMDNGNQPLIDFFGDDPENNANAGTHLGFAPSNAGVTKTSADTGAEDPILILNKSVAATGALDTYSIDLNGSGSSVELRMIANFAFLSYTFDNIVFTTAGGDKGLLGDVNCDGAVDLLDVQPFVALIQTGGFSTKADIDMNGVVDLLDVQPFVDLITGG